MPQVPGRTTRAALAGIDAFTAITAVGGGLALAVGLEAGRFPESWLAGTPFTSYVMPGLILAGVVGGAALMAALALMRVPVLGGRISMLAGAVLLGWILGEIVLLTGDGELISSLEVVYVATGAVMVALGYRVAGGQSARGPE